MQWNGCGRAGSLLGLAIVAAGSAHAGGDVELDFSGAKLSLNGGVFRPVDERRSFGAEVISGDSCISIEDRRIVSRRAGQIVWQTEVPDGIQLTWLSTASRSASLLTGANKRGQPDRVLDDHVRVLNLETGGWLAPIRLLRDGSPMSATAAAAVETPNGVVIAQNHAGEVILHAFEWNADRTDVRPTWTSVVRTEPLAAPREHAALLGEQAAERAASSDIGLAVVGDRLVVCSRPTGSVHGLELANGHVAWMIERPWEFQRGFIGPSVWSEFISRSGRPDWFADGEAAPNPPEPVGFAAIIAGPVVPKGADSCFIASGVTQDDQWPLRVLEASVLEISSLGEPVAFAQLPRRPVAATVTAIDGAVVFGCRESSLVCLRPLRGSCIGMGIGGSAIADVRWFLRYDTDSDESAFISAPGVPDVLSIGDRFAWAAGSGVRVDAPNDTSIRMDVSRITLKAPSTEIGTLEIPFKGSFPLPDSNYSRTTTPGRFSSTRSHVPMIAAITGIVADGEVLLVTVGTENSATTLEFRIPAK